MLRRPLGATGIEVTALGLGAMQVGSPDIDEAGAAGLLNGALDLGIRLLDTARSYGLAEERIGRHLARRRDEFVLSTKVGYGVEGVEDWTPECVRRGIDDARRRLRSDVIDVVHLHSCDAAVLGRPGLLDAVQEAVAQGKVRVAGYSGDNEPAHMAAASGAVGVIQVSLNLCDQRAIPAVETWASQGLGVLAKRPLAGLPWRGLQVAGEPVHQEYRRRFERMALPEEPDWTDFALRFAAFAPGVAACLVGGTRLEHLARNVASVARGALASHERRRVEAAFVEAGAGWPGMI